MKPICKISHYINSFSISCGYFFIVLGVMLIFMEVVLRYVFNFGFRWVEELTCYSFIYVALLGASTVSKDNEQMKIDVFRKLFSPGLQYSISLVFSALTLLFLGVLTYEGIKFFKVGLGGKSAALEVNLAIPYLAVPLGALFMFIQEVRNLLKNLTDGKNV